MDNREIVIEPYQKGWIAYYPGARWHRVIADSPDQARAMLAESAREGLIPRQINVTDPMRAVALACLLIGAIVVAYALKPAPQAGAPTRWAHHTGHHTQSH